MQGGLNTFGYVNQSPTRYFDPEGLDINITVNTEGALGAGHIRGGVAGGNGVTGNPSRGFYPVTEGDPFDDGVLKNDENQNASSLIPTTPDQDRRFKHCMNTIQQNPPKYNLLTNNCNHTIKQCDLGAISPSTPSSVIDDLSGYFPDSAADACAMQ